MNTLTLTDATFAVETGTSDPILVDFWAPWCAPCRMMSPVVDALARSHAGRLRVGKLNVDEHPGTAGTYDVRSIPTLILFHRGRAVTRWVDAPRAAVLVARVDRELSRLAGRSAAVTR